MTPTPGRVVTYHLPTDGESTIPCLCSSATLSAKIAHVNDDGTVNLAILDSTGTWHGRLSVPFIQGHAERPEAGNYACWPPHVKHEEPKPAEAEQAESGNGENTEAAKAEGVDVPAGKKPKKH